MAVHNARLTMAAALLVVVPAGLVSRRIDAAPHLANALGGALYALAGILFLHALWPRARTGAIAAFVLVGTCAVELAQLCDASWLVELRSTTPGRLLLGANGGFDPLDFPNYALGCALGYALCTRLLRVTQSPAGSRELPPARDAPGS